MAKTLWNTHSFTILLGGEAGTTSVDMLTYDPILSRIRVDVSVAATIDGAPAPAGATLTVERSTDLVHWTTVRGGASLDVSADALPLDDYEFTPDAENQYRLLVYDGDVGILLHTFIDALEVFLTDVWIKSPARPFLNRTVHVETFGDIDSPDNGAVFTIVGRSRGVARTDVHGPASHELHVYANDRAAADAMEKVVVSGDVILVQAPTSVNVPTGYFYVARTKMHRWPTANADFTEPRSYVLPLTEVEAPRPSIGSASITWRGVANRFASWQSVLDAEASWRALMELIGSPDDVIVP